MLDLKSLSLLTLAVQNAALSIVMHYSRVRVPSAQSYSPASAVLLNELFKGTLSFIIALSNARDLALASSSRRPLLAPSSLWSHALSQVYADVFSPDCWKLSIPALLYVVQNSLQFVAVSNLPVASFQVSYQMKILTTAAFSVLLLRKRLGSTKWLSLFFLAIGVAIVQLSTVVPSSSPPDGPVGSAHDSAPRHLHEMNPFKGFAAVVAACFTSGLAGVYFEMVLKNSKADLWVRNVQLSLFSLVPALLPVLATTHPASPFPASLVHLDLFRNFGFWAWATVAIQVFGGLVTAVVIKYSDNILKGFATSLSILISFLASVVLFDFRITPSFVVGASMVLVATWMYNQPSPSCTTPPTLSHPHPYLSDSFGRKKSSALYSNGSSAGYDDKPRGVASALGIDTTEVTTASLSETLGSARYLESPYGSPFPSRTPSPSVHSFGADARRKS